MQEVQDKALAFLEANPAVEAVFATTDGFLFYKEYDAQNHALSLNKENPEVEAFFRNEIEAKANIEPKVKVEVEEIDPKEKVEIEKEEKVEKPKKK